MKKALFIFSFIFLMSIFSSSGSKATVLRCASTTSTQNSGLFDFLLPVFKKETGITVHVIAVGTGAALQLVKRGDVDVVLVHARDAVCFSPAKSIFAVYDSSGPSNGLFLSSEYNSSNLFTGNSYPPMRDIQP